MVEDEIDPRAGTFVRILSRADFVKAGEDELRQYIPSRIGPIITGAGQGTLDRKRNYEGGFLQLTQRIEPRAVRSISSVDPEPRKLRCKIRDCGFSMCIDMKKCNRIEK
jgi:hypothetical protein